MQTQAEKASQEGKAGRMGESNRNGDADNNGQNSDHDTKSRRCVETSPDKLGKPPPGGWSLAPESSSEGAVRGRQARVQTHTCTQHTYAHTYRHTYVAHTMHSPVSTENTYAQSALTHTHTSTNTHTAKQRGG